MSKPSAGAGLVHAPPFNPQSEIDPASAPTVGEGGSDDLQSLAYYKEQHDRQTLRARGLLLTIIFLMLAGNLVMTQRAQSSIMSNLDQTRLDQAALSEIVETRVSALETQVEELTSQLQQAPPAAPAVAAAE